MPRKRDPRRDEAFQIWKNSNGTKLLKDIAAELGVADSQIRKWKSQDKWDSLLKGNVTKPKRSVTNRGGAPKGNKNALGNRGGAAPKGNSNAVTHGFFRTIFPDDEETNSIIDAIEIKSPIDMLWENIVIQYTAIARSQKIMFVTGKDEMIKELKKRKEDSGENYETLEEEWEFQFAWDRQATLLQAQSRAMATLQSLIRQYEEMVRQGFADEEQSLRISKMKAEIDKIKGGNKDEESEEWIAGLKAVANKRRQLKGDVNE